jgi:hypothetical protein
VAILLTAVMISVPPVNALIHGTYVVTGHAMGATVTGIDKIGGDYRGVGAAAGARGQHLLRRPDPRHRHHVLQHQT